MHLRARGSTASESGASEPPRWGNALREAIWPDSPLTTDLMSRENPKRLTGALLDRLTHHVHILDMSGEGYRLKQSKRRRGLESPAA